MEFIWACMAISLKGILGTIFWFIAIALSGVGIAMVISFISFLILGSKIKKEENKPKYEGKPIVIKGGKDE
jgi:hypothetical protein